MDALSISYSGESEATLWIENSVLTVSLIRRLNLIVRYNSWRAVTGPKFSRWHNLKSIADADMEASELNEVAMAYPADIKSQPYFLGQGNYSSPKKVSEVFPQKCPRDKELLA